MYSFKRIARARPAADAGRRRATRCLWIDTAQAQPDAGRDATRTVQAAAKLSPKALDNPATHLRGHPLLRLLFIVV